MFSQKPLLTAVATAVITIAATVTATTMATASDGVFEINQTCAVTTGCFDGDSPGFPVTISGNTGGSYVLTSSLATSSSTDAMINVRANRITLDLGGFSVSNSVSGSGTADVINGNLLGGYAVIRNGSIRGGGGQGVDFSSTAGTRVEDVFFLNQGGGAILVGDESLVRNNRVTSSTAQSGAGISVGDRSEVSKNLVSGAAADGIVAGEGSTVSGNNVSASGGDGIDSGRGSNIFENTASSNGAVGIRLNARGRISGNSVDGNGSDGIRASFASLISDNLVTYNLGAGIVARETATLIGNNVAFNTGIALDLTASTYRNNNVWTPTGGVVAIGGIDAGGNICNGTTSNCP